MKSDPSLTIAIAVIAAVAALVGAIIAAWTAGRRQQRQLTHEGERQRNQLSHDRELADLSELRALLDECAVMLAATFHSYANAVSSLDQVDRLESAAAMLQEQNAPDFIVREAIEGVVETKRAPESAIGQVMEAQALGERISIRLSNETLREHYDAAVRALFAGTQQFPGPGRQPSAEQRELYERAGDAFEMARSAFASAARDLVGSRITASTTSLRDAR